MGTGQRFGGARVLAMAGAVSITAAAAATFGWHHERAGAGPASAAGPSVPSTTVETTTAPPTAAPTTTTTPPTTALPTTSIRPTTTETPDTTASTTTPTDPAPPAACAGGWSSAELNHLLRDHAAGGIVGADYARAQRLADGRVLWTFQDVFLGSDPSTLDGTNFVHNAGLVQSGSCFRLLTGGTTTEPRSWIGGDTEVLRRSWFWPMDSMTTADGHIALFLARFENPRGTGAAYGARPVGVWIATIRPSDLHVVSLAPAPDAGDRPLYGFSITSDEEHTYLYGNCYRQFTESKFLHVHHDAECGPKMYVARIPRGRPDLEPTYWDGTAWSRDRAAAAPIMTRGQAANPMQVRFLEGRFVSVTKVDDWWGDTVVVDVAPTPVGPWTTTATIRPATVCDCSTYFAHLLPWADADGSPVIAISSNGWSFAETRRHADHYRTRFIPVHDIAGAASRS